MILWAGFCLYLAASIQGEQPPGGDAGGFSQRGYESELPGGIIGENDPNPRGQISKFLASGSEVNLDEGEKRQTPRGGVLDPEVADQLEGNGWLDVIPGTPGKDYPNYEKIPRTSFTCDDKTAGGYYADVEARCQVFHVCNTGGQKSSFVCPSGSIFNQKYLVCDWWYDFECDDATDLYSLNEKINRGGTGSGPSGPGRSEQSGEYSSYGENLPREEPRNDGNFVYADAGFDLSLAGTGEGGPGYAQKNANNKGYQSNVDGEDYEEKQEEEREKIRRKNAGKNRGKNEERSKGGEASSGSNGDRENFNKQNSQGNFNGRFKTGDFRNGNGPGNDEKINADNHPRREAQKTGNDSRDEKRSGFGQRSADYDRSSPPSGYNSEDFSNFHAGRGEEGEKSFAEEFDAGKSAAPSYSGSDNSEYRSSSSGSRPANIRGRQRANGGLPGGLGNGYPSAGRARELPGSDAIGSSITRGEGTLYDEGDQRSVDSQRGITSSDTRIFTAVTDSQKIGSDHRNQQIQKPDYRQDNPATRSESYDNQSSRNRKYSLREEKSSNRQENNNQNNNGNDYLVGIVPGNDDRGNGSSSSRYLPIL